MMNKKYTDIRVMGGEEEIREFLGLCALIQQLGAEGASGTISTVVDGDGSARLRFNVNGEELPGAQRDLSKDLKIHIGE